ncbi:protealysin inhibitor emfourin [Pseudarthrobacter sp. N5]|uniref:protealysin inhibitor emfourin n=1 Tax=Pseudarthrobacter sp. N5 TaxID=3418416 RepID=UPI003CF3F499
MKITVQRSGGIAALTRVWTVKAVTTSDKNRWRPLVEACPWGAVPTTRDAAAGGQPDRFMYSIRAGQRRATLPERAVTGPWRVLVDKTRAAAEESPGNAGRGQTGAAPGSGQG